VLREARDERLDGEILRGALAPVLELHENLALVLAAAGEIEAVTMNDRGTILFSP